LAARAAEIMSLLGSYWVAEPVTQFMMQSWDVKAVVREEREV
jgi:hypothetical protein